MRVLLLEDERPARESLESAIHDWDDQVEIIECFDAVSMATRWLLANPTPDLIFADIRLTDGLSFEVFERAQVACPVVFVTAYDRYVLDAFEQGGIDYLLKPIDPARVARSLDRFLRLRAHFQEGAAVPATPERWSGLRERLAGAPPRERLLVRRGRDVITVPVEEIAWFTTEHRLVFLVAHDGRRHVVDKTLTQLEAELDGQRFFRVSRSSLVALRAVRGFRSGGKGRLLVRLSPDDDEVVVSADCAAAFKGWLDR